MMRAVCTVLVFATTTIAVRPTAKDDTPPQVLQNWAEEVKQREEKIEQLKQKRDEAMSKMGDELMQEEEKLNALKEQEAAASTSTAPGDILYAASTPAPEEASPLALQKDAQDRLVEAVKQEKLAIGELKKKQKTALDDIQEKLQNEKKQVEELEDLQAKQKSAIDNIDDEEASFREKIKAQPATEPALFEDEPTTTGPAVFLEQPVRDDR